MTDVNLIIPMWLGVVFVATTLFNLAATYYLLTEQSRRSYHLQDRPPAEDQLVQVLHPLDEDDRIIHKLRDLLEDFPHIQRRTDGSGKEL